MKHKVYRFWVYYYDIDGIEIALPIDAKCSQTAMREWWNIRETLAVGDWRPWMHYLEIEGYGNVGKISIDAPTN